MPQKERADTYTIPPNFAKEGTILSGRVETRNAVEAAVLVFFLLQVLLSLDCGTKAKIYAGVIVIIPVAIFAVIGVQGESLTSFIFQFFRYLIKRRTLTVPDAKYRLKRNRRIRKKGSHRTKIAGQKRGDKNGKRNSGIENETEKSQTDGKTKAEGSEEGRKDKKEGCG